MPAPVQEEWPSLGGKTGPHRMAGTMPPPPTREMWAPPPGWMPPTKPVLSWYDMGKRLTPPVTPMSELEQVEMAKAEAVIDDLASVREGSVTSWYDSGVRLTA